MIKILKISVQGFRVFTKKQTLDLSNFPPGLFFIFGNNLVEPHLGANDCGKSSLAEAICVCFFGKTSCNLRATDIVNWEKSEKCVISVELEKDNVTYIITRTLSPNKLTLKNLHTNTEEIKVQENIDEFLGCNFNSFLYSTYIAQFTQKFVDLSIPEKMEVFTDFIGNDLQIWDKYVQKSKDKIKGIEQEITVINNDTLTKQGKLSILKSKNYNEQIQYHENEKKVFSDKYLVESQQLKHNIDDITNIKIAQLLEKCEILEKEKETFTQFLLIENQKEISLTAKIEDIQNVISEKNSNLTTIKIKIAKDTTTLDSLAILIKKATKLSGSTCPTCNQLVDPEHIKKEVNALNKKMQESIDVITDLRKTEDDIISTIKQLIETKLSIINEKTQITLKYAPIKDKINTINKDLHDIEKQAIYLDNLKQSYIKDLKTLDEKKLTYEKENPYIKLEIETNNVISIYERSVFCNNEQIKEYTEKLEILKYWVKSFNEIKLIVLNNKLKELELFINDVLNSFGMNKWEIIVNSSSETKSGTIKNGLSIFIKSYLNDTIVPFECWGGGIGQRLRLACTLGLMAFIQNNIQGFDIEIFDEPTQFLAEQGINDLLDILYNKAISNNKKIFIIDHRGLETKGMFTGIITINKDIDGSRIE